MSKATKRKQAKPRKRAEAMARATDYRKRAEECVAMARTARTSAQHTMLMHIADTWERLAKEAEDNVVPAAAENPRRPATVM